MRSIALAFALYTVVTLAAAPQGISDKMRLERLRGDPAPELTGGGQ
jgi:hypothetical protein